MSDQHEPFLQAIESEADPSLPLSVYADWLEEVGGDPLRIFACRKLADHPDRLTSGYHPAVMDEAVKHKGFKSRRDAIVFWSSRRQPMFELDFGYLEEGVMIVHLLGDQFVPDGVRDASELIKFHDVSNAILNFADVNHISSSVLGGMIRLFRQLNQQKGVLVLCNLSRQILEIMQIVRLDRLFLVHADMESAIAGTLAHNSKQQDA